MELAICNPIRLDMARGPGLGATGPRECRMGRRMGKIAGGGGGGGVPLRGGVWTNLILASILIFLFCLAFR